VVFLRFVTVELGWWSGGCLGCYGGARVERERERKLVRVGDVAEDEWGKVAK
jgi:hypothetical protein